MREVAEADDATIAEACARARHAQPGWAATPLFLVTETDDLLVITSDLSLAPKAGQTLVSLVDAQAPGT